MSYCNHMVTHFREEGHRSGVAAMHSSNLAGVGSRGGSAPLDSGPISDRYSHRTQLTSSAADPPHVHVGDTASSVDGSCDVDSNPSLCSPAGTEGYRGRRHEEVNATMLLAMVGVDALISAHGIPTDNQLAQLFAAPQVVPGEPPITAPSSLRQHMCFVNLAAHQRVVGRGYACTGSWCRGQGAHHPLNLPDYQDYQMMTCQSQLMM
jgi:hypothetical protein